MTDERSAWREPYFTDGDGRRWHVYDVARVDGRIRRLDLGAPEATQRIFVAEDGRHTPASTFVLLVAHTFDRGEPREQTAELLERQLRAAKHRAAWENTFQPTRRARR